MSSYKVRQEYLKYIYSEIDQLLKHKDKIKILEVGCGNCINAVNILEKYGDRIQYSGFDISEQRIAVSKRYFKDRLSKGNFFVGNIVDGIPYDDNEFDIVFSMHCLEQISYHCYFAVKEMYRLTKLKLIMLEPVFELGNTAQRLYLIHADHVRILLKSINELGYRIENIQVADIQANPLNQTTFIVINKGNPVSIGFP